MSEASASAHVRITIADYVVIDTNSKITMVGGGITIVGIIAESAMSAAFGVLASVSFAPKCVGTAPRILLSLETADGQPVHLPGRPEPLQLPLSTRLDPPRLPDVSIPKGVVRPKAQLVLQFQSGLPLPAGQAYTWRIAVDDQTRDEWTETFYIPTDVVG